MKKIQLVLGSGRTRGIAQTLVFSRAKKIYVLGVNVYKENRKQILKKIDPA